MTTVAGRAALADPEAEPSRRTTPWLVASGLASLGAGAVHFAAAGVHGDHPAAVRVFLALGLAQVGWGGAALARRDRLTAQLGVVLGVAAVVGWAVAKSVGLPYVAGLATPEPVGFADVSAAVLAAASTVPAIVAAGPRTGRGLPLPTWAVAVVLASLTAAGTVATSQHDHAGTHVHEAAAAAGHVHAVPYDPALPVDLGGTPGVTPQQQAAAEQLVEITLARLPHWSDARVAERAGFRSIGDGFTGTEHLINAAYLRDGTTLDPDRPESLVYDTTSGHRRLVAAMYMLAPGTPLSAVPDVGGALVQWHVHDNLCFSPSGYVQGLTNAAGQCPSGQVKPTPTPMVHVWITKNPCGPFAALEGIGGGTIAPGQTRLCDHLHGS